MKKDIIKLLNLQNVWVDTWQIRKDEIVVKIRSPKTKDICPRCGITSGRIHQYHRRRIKHSIWQSRRVILDLKVKRFYCKYCKKPFTEYISNIDRKRTTKNFRNIVLKDMSNQSLNSVKKQNKISHSTMYDILKENYDNTKNIDWKKQGKNITLGIDEHSFRGRGRFVLTATNITKKKLLMIGKDHSIKTLSNFLNNTDKARIKEVCIDMKQGYLNTILKELPNAKVVVDKFHVVSHANKVMNEVRSIVIGKEYRTKKLMSWGKEKLNDADTIRLKMLFEKYKAFPSLYQAYFIKEKVRDFYKLKNKKKASVKLAQIIMFCETSNSNYLKNLGRTFRRWREYILNYFNKYSTNAFTEGVHTKIKMMKRVSFGFRNVNHYIAKMMLAFAPLLYVIHHTY
jgi:transposase